MSFKLDCARTAVVLIDLQTGILAMPLTPHDRASVVAACATLARAAKAAGGALALVNVAFSADGADRPRGLVDQMIAAPPGGFPADWSALHPEIDALPADIRVTKRHWSAFADTELDLQLRRRGIDTVIVAGVSTNFGVESTARDGWQLNYNIIVAHDASSTLGADMHQFALEKTLPRVARVRSVAQIVDALSA